MVEFLKEYFWIILIFSAIVRSLDQLTIFSYTQSWLPEKFFTWKVYKIFDAVHTYMGIKLVSFGLGFLFYNWDYWTIPLTIYLYYQVFNLFFHVVWRYPEFWEIPFFRFLFYKRY